MKKIEKDLKQLEKVIKEETPSKLEKMFNEIMRGIPVERVNQFYKDDLIWREKKMPEFGKRSKANLETCHPLLQHLFKEVVKEFDCSVIEGHRDKEKQDQMVKEGKSKLNYPDSKHNSNPSMAADVVPYPVKWDDEGQFCYFAGYVKGVADRLGIKITWGGDWSSNFKRSDNRFDDLPHFQLEEE